MILIIKVNSSSLHNKIKFITLHEIAVVFVTYNHLISILLIRTVDNDFAFSILFPIMLLKNNPVGKYPTNKNGNASSVFFSANSQEPSRPIHNTYVFC